MIGKFIIVILFFISSLPLSAQEEIKAMSYNIRLDIASDGDNRWDIRKDKVASLMNYYEADFIGMQEVLLNQLKYLQQQLNKYNYIGVGRDDGKEVGEYSCIFYRKEKFDLIRQSTFWLSPTPDSPSKAWDAAYKRVCTYGLFRDKKTKLQFWVFNTHFDHVGKTARLESAKLIIERIHELNNKNYPVILMGDFNSKPEEPPVEYIMANMYNSRAISKMIHGPADTWNAFKFHEKPNGCIDYVFVSKGKGISVSKFITITDSYDLRYPSDHLPVMATILINK